jgi:hypothetical protein
MRGLGHAPIDFGVNELSLQAGSGGSENRPRGTRNTPAPARKSSAIAAGTENSRTRITNSLYVLGGGPGIQRAGTSATE